MKTPKLWFLFLLLTPLLSLAAPKDFLIQGDNSTPHAIVYPAIASKQALEAPITYSQAQIDSWLSKTANSGFLRKIILCESENQNVARMDSNNVMSYGLLQFIGTATWNEFAPKAGIFNSSPMNPEDAIKVADWMISHGYISRWTCARLTGLIN
jgi:hypothetical protein